MPALRNLFARGVAFATTRNSRSFDLSPTRHAGPGNFLRKRMKTIIVATCYSTLQKAKRDPSTRSAILIGSHKTLTQDDTAKMKDDKTRWRAEARRYTATNEQCPFPERADTLARVGSPPPFFFAVSSRSKRLSARRGISLRVPISPRMICKCSRHASSCLALCRTPRRVERAQTLLPASRIVQSKKTQGGNECAGR